MMNILIKEIINNQAEYKFYTDNKKRDFHNSLTNYNLKIIFIYAIYILKRK